MLPDSYMDRSQLTIYAQEVIQVLRNTHYSPVDVTPEMGVVDYYFVWSRWIHRLEGMERWYPLVEQYEKLAAEKLLCHTKKDHNWWLKYTGTGCLWEDSNIYNVLERLDDYFYSYKSESATNWHWLNNVNVHVLPDIPLFSGEEKASLNKEITNPWNPSGISLLCREMQMYLYLWNKAMGNVIIHDTLLETCTVQERCYIELGEYNAVWQLHMGRYTASHSSETFVWF